jgi:hypothetical protein
LFWHFSLIINVKNGFAQTIPPTKLNTLAREVNMNLSFKDLRFIAGAVELQIKTYKSRLQVIEEVDEDEAADLGNDIRYLETLHSEMTTILNQNKLADLFITANS